MVCWRCQTANSDFAVYCSKCGLPLTKRPGGLRWKNPWLVIAASGLALLGVAAVLYVVLSRRPPAGNVRSAEPPPAEAVVEAGPSLFFPGEVIVGDPAALRPTRSAAPVFGAGWVATPVWALFGGAEIRFRGGDGPDLPIDQGFWNEGDPIVLWKLTDAPTEELSGFGAWRRGDPLLWRPLAAGSASLRVEVAGPQPRGFYLSFVLPAEVKEAGILFQESRVVGWTFGEEMESGYLWAGPGEGDLFPNLGADRVFATVASGREVGFFRAAALGEEADAGERLSAFAQGFRSAPWLRDEDLPFRFRAPSVIARMRALSAELARNGRAQDVVRILDEGVLAEAADPELVKAAVLAQAHDQDYNRAIQYLGRLRKTVFDARGLDASTLEPFRAQLYKDWIREILDKGGYFSAQVAYEEAARAFPDDPVIRLLGVEVALAENDPEKAKELLRARDLPPLLQDRVDRLAARIKTQEDEQELVIPFNPAQNRIILEAKLNGTFRLRFLVDTGAMMSSVPSAAASALGIEVDQTTPVRAVTTASGIILVAEVFLNSIDIAGYRVENVKVLLLDLPADSTIGILGMDFLNNFRYEIDNQAGVFRLRKK